MRLRNLAAGLALLVTGTIVGVTTQQLASADVSSGDRPVLVPIESCRLIDTRPAFNVGPRTAPLGPTETLTLDTQQAGTECSGQIPTTATAIAANVTAPESNGGSFITLWDSGPRPNGSTLNPAPGQLVFNAATIPLDGTSFQVYNNANNVHIIIDIIGYYDNHDHDDRYYTKTQADDRYYTKTQADGRYYTRDEIDALTPFMATSDFELSTIPGSADTVVQDLELDAPSAGTVLLNYSLILSGSTGERVACSIGTGTVYSDVNGSTVVDIPNSRTSSSGSRVMTVDAGQTTFNLVCWSVFDDSHTVFNPSITALFTPTP